jgi:hypothetical protein
VKKNQQLERAQPVQLPLNRAGIVNSFLKAILVHADILAKRRAAERRTRKSVRAGHNCSVTTDERCPCLRVNARRCQIQPCTRYQTSPTISCKVSSFQAMGSQFGRNS